MHSKLHEIVGLKHFRAEEYRASSALEQVGQLGQFNEVSRSNISFHPQHCISSSVDLPERHLKKLTSVSEAEFKDFSMCHRDSIFPEEADLPETNLFH